MTEAPKVIYLEPDDPDFEGELSGDWEGRCWCECNTWGNGIKYVRADLVQDQSEFIETGR